MQQHIHIHVKVVIAVFIFFVIFVFIKKKGLFVRKAPLYILGRTGFSGNHTHIMQQQLL
jgi:hypothetical protein